MKRQKLTKQTINYIGNHFTDSETVIFFFSLQNDNNSTFLRMFKTYV